MISELASRISRKPGLRPKARASDMAGQALGPRKPYPWAWLGLAFSTRAWPGLGPEARARPSLD
jgi:hypothetical protein